MIAGTRRGAVHEGVDVAATSAVDVTCGALGTRIAAALRLLAAGDPFVREAQTGSTHADKAACEQLILLRGISRNLPAHQLRQPEWTAVMAALLDTSELRMRSPAIREALFWRPERAPQLAMGTALLDQLGRESELWRAHVNMAWDEAFQGMTDCSPYQVLERRWSRALLDGGGPEHFSWTQNDRNQLCRSGWVALMTQDDAYAWTHSIFYLTDFGRLSPSPIAASIGDLQSQLDAAICWSLARYDFDLLGEFLLSAIYVGAAGSWRWTVGLLILLATWDQFGWVPDRSIDDEMTSPGERSASFFFATYHANLVAGLLASELVSRAQTVRQSRCHRGRDARRASQNPDGAAMFGGEVWARVESSAEEAAIAATLLEVSTLRAFWRRDRAAVAAGIEAMLRGDRPSAFLSGASHWLGRNLADGSFSTPRVSGQRPAPSSGAV